MGDGRFAHAGVLVLQRALCRQRGIGGLYQCRLTDFRGRVVADQRGQQTVIVEAARGRGADALVGIFGDDASQQRLILDAAHRVGAHVAGRRAGQQFGAGAHSLQPTTGLGGPSRRRGRVPGRVRPAF